ncbi:MAG: 2OG-Fe(II) oxygenase [Polyangiaceae bacterium]|nr:2OG-Fe(II) oxygenase [Polyangiaceae bacterium]
MQAAPRPLVRLAQRPRVYVHDDFVSHEVVRYVLDRYGSREALDARGIEWEANETGLSGELPVEDDPVLEQLAERIEDALGFRCTLLQRTFRFRRYSVGDFHPPHVDSYAIAGAHLIATAIVYLTDAEVGGETYFPDARPVPVSITPKARRLAVWFNHEPNGELDRTSQHRSEKLVAGDKATIAYFVYAPLDHASVDLDAEPPKRSGADKPVRRRRFVCVDDGVPEATRRVLREACAERDVEFEVIEAEAFDFASAKPLPPGTMLYRPAVSMLATRVEQALFGPGVATFYVGHDGIFRSVGPDLVMFEQAGVPVPRWLWATTTDRARLRKYVDVLGGLPLVLKFSNTSGGVGVLRIDTLAGLFSTMDHARASGRIPQLMTYIPDAIHWRCIVVGDRVVGFYRNRTDPDDFRTHASDDPCDYRDPPSPEILGSAIRSAAAIDVEFGGVDVLEDASGQHYVIECNFPCYFARAKLVGGHDVAGSMIDWLARKADRLVSSLGQTAR